MKRISTVQGAKRRIESYSQILAECSNQVSDNRKFEHHMSTCIILFSDFQVHTVDLSKLHTL